jgi:hypothetical protein
MIDEPNVLELEVTLSQSESSLDGRMLTSVGGVETILRIDIDLGRQLRTI